MSSMSLSHHLRLAYFLAALAVSPALGVLAAADPPQLHNTLGTDNPTTPPIHNALPSTDEAAPAAGNNVPSSQLHHTPFGATQDDLVPPAALGNAVTIAADQTQLEQILKDISTKSGLSMVVNWTALQGAGFDKNTPITLNVPAPITAAHALTLVCSQAGGGNFSLGWTTLNNVVHVSTKDELSSAKYQRVRFYDIVDLVGRDLADVQLRDDRVKTIIALITSAIAPDSWRDSGGTVGSIREFDCILIINQIAENHQAIMTLLAQIRAVRAARR